jgi:predicted ribosomally synthesized peptide with nif11-like leader
MNGKTNKGRVLLMSMENARAFYEKVKADQILQQKIGELAKEKPAETEAIIIKVAGEKGFPFTLEEMRTVMKELTKKAPDHGELSDAELEAVAGGSKDYFGFILGSIATLGLVCVISASDKTARC